MGRMQKVNQQMKREMGIIIQREMSDPRVQFVTITRVDVSPDFKNAKIYFSVLGNTGQCEAAQVALNHAAGMARHQVSQRMSLRRTPEIRFHYDDTVEASSNIEQTLKEINDEYEKNHSDDSE